MFKLGSPPPPQAALPDATNAQNLKMKKPEQDSITPRNNLQQTYSIQILLIR